MQTLTLHQRLKILTDTVKNQAAASHKSDLFIAIAVQAAQDIAEQQVAGMDYLSVLADLRGSKKVMRRRFGVDAVTARLMIFSDTISEIERVGVCSDWFRLLLKQFEILKKDELTEYVFEHKAQAMRDVQEALKFIERRGGK